MTSRKYSVTIEDCPEEDLMGSQTGRSDIGSQLYQFGQSSVFEDNPSQHGAKQSWDQMNDMENQARMEKLQDAPTAMKTANKVAHLVQQDVHGKK